MYLNFQWRKNPRAHRNTRAQEARSHPVHFQTSEQEFHGGVQETGAPGARQSHHAGGH